MDNAELYQKNNNLQKRDALQCLEEYVKKIKWKNEGDTVIDIGSGDGSVTVSILQQFLPASCKRVLGCDISENMVQFANKHYGTATTSFALLDIEADLPYNLKGSFDHAFSFYTLHWIKQQEVAFTNIFRLLARNGDCLLIFPGHLPLYDVYRILARKHKWSHWLTDVDRFVSLYHDCQDPEKEIKRMMIAIGFTNVDVQCIEKSYNYPSMQSVKDSVAAINPFKMPKDVLQEFLEDYVKIVRDMQRIDHTDDGVVDVRVTYQIIVAYGRKP